MKIRSTAVNHLDLVEASGTLQDAAQAWKDIARNLSPGGPGAARRRSHGKIVLRVA